MRGSRTNFSYDKNDTLFMAAFRQWVTAYIGFTRRRSKPLDVVKENVLIGEPNALENDWYRVEFESHTGHISRLYDKKNDTEVLRGNGAVPIVIDETHCDTWAHGVFEFRNEIAEVRGCDR